MVKKPAMYIFLNRGLGMSEGKAAAQASHAAIEAYRLSNDHLVAEWYSGGHSTKLVMLARDNEHIRTIQKYLEDRGFRTKLIIDEGLTEIAPHQPTALGVEVVDRAEQHVVDTFSTFELYRSRIRVTMEVEK